jgi:hypothetical protein
MICPENDAGNNISQDGTRTRSPCELGVVEHA